MNSEIDALPMPLSKDLREFVESLNSNGVEYVVGAFAVAHHGYPRYTGDLDVLVRCTAENAERVLGTIARFGFGNIGITRRDLESPGMVIQLGVQPNRIDIVTSISGVSFDEVWAGRQGGVLENTPTQFIGRAALIKNKESTGRAKVLGDEELKKRSPKG